MYYFVGRSSCKSFLTNKPEVDAIFRERSSRGSTDRTISDLVLLLADRRFPSGRLWTARPSNGVFLSGYRQNHVTVVAVNGQPEVGSVYIAIRLFVQISAQVLLLVDGLLTSGADFQ